MPSSSAKLKDMNLDELKNQLQFTPDGLGSEDAAKRLEEYGCNELAENKSSPGPEISLPLSGAGSPR